MDEQYDELTSLALRARRGDADAATTFVRGTQADVWRMCANLGSRALADDLTQETYARAFASLHRFAGRSAVRTWLLSIARRVCADAVHEVVKTRAHVESGAVDLTSVRSLTAFDPAESVALTSLLQGLDRDRREAFVLTQLVGLSYAEAADVCNCPVGTIRSRVARARADLVDGYGGGRAQAVGD
ncbi:MAG: sigma-70 family RNA polymerase sigma factor [Jatrophihabitantaceae bacterium]